jgi:predicted dinucleotide-binding enzyme
MPGSALVRIGLIGAGHIGATLARLAVAHGHVVMVSNSRGPQTLGDLVDELSEHASAGTAQEAAAFGDVVVVSIPLKNYRQVPVEELVGKVVVDTNNYYPQRDGQIPELDRDSTTSAELLAAHLPSSRIVKAFNNIRSADLASQGEAAGTPGRRALPIAGDDPQAKSVVAALVDEFGFDVVDAGLLAQGRRFQRDEPAYIHRFDVDGLRTALDASPSARAR